MNPLDAIEAEGPRGHTGLLGWLGNIELPYREAPALDHVLARRDAERPWLLVLWEPLSGAEAPAIPGPAEAGPWCCYLNTVIFYALDAGGGYIIDVDRGVFREHARREHAFYGEDVIEWRGAYADRVEPEMFTVFGGRVVSAARAGAAASWWMLHRARRIHVDDTNLKARAHEARRLRLKASA